MSHPPCPVDLKFQFLGIYSSMSDDLIDEPFLISVFSKVIELLCFPFREEVIVICDVPSDKAGMEGRRHVLIL
jgi:hypothetical protein